MKDSAKHETRKILVKIWEPLLNRLDERLRFTLMKRDSFLDRVLSHEIKMLKKEIQVPNSEFVRSSISTALEKTPRKTVNLNLSSETVVLVTDTCKSLNIPRDAFINRIIFFLTASVNLIDITLFNEDFDSPFEEWVMHGVIGQGNYEESFPFRANVLDSIGEFIRSDPFWLLRATLKVRSEEENVNSEIRNEPGFYNQFIKPKALANLSESDHSSLAPLEISNCAFLNCAVGAKDSVYFDKLEEHEFENSLDLLISEIEGERKRFSNLIAIQKSKTGDQK